MRNAPEYRTVDSLAPLRPPVDEALPALIELHDIRLESDPVLQRRSQHIAASTKSSSHQPPIGAG